MQFVGYSASGGPVTLSMLLGITFLFYICQALLLLSRTFGLFFLYLFSFLFLIFFRTRKKERAIAFRCNFHNGSQLRRWYVRTIRVSFQSQLSQLGRLWPPTRDSRHGKGQLLRASVLKKERSRSPGRFCTRRPRLCSLAYFMNLLCHLNNSLSLILAATATRELRFLQYFQTFYLLSFCKSNFTLRTVHLLRVAFAQYPHCPQPFGPKNTK